MPQRGVQTTQVLQRCGDVTDALQSIRNVEYDPPLSYGPTRAHGVAGGTSWPWWSIYRRTRTWTWCVASSRGYGPPPRGVYPNARGSQRQPRVGDGIPEGPGCPFRPMGGFPTGHWLVRQLRDMLLATLRMAAYQPRVTYHPLGLALRPYL